MEARFKSSSHDGSRPPCLYLLPMHAQCTQQEQSEKNTTTELENFSVHTHTQADQYKHVLRAPAMALVPPASTSTSSSAVNPSPNLNSSQYNGKIIIASLSMLCFVVLFILALHIYAKWFWRLSTRRQQSLWRRRHAAPFQDHEEPLTAGLDKSVVDSLPTFTYKLSEVFAQEGGALECAVCLSEFQENEKGRLLPKCCHSFHTKCIDMWFLSHTTCPLCRTSADPRDTRELPTNAVAIAGELELGVLARHEQSTLPQPGLRLLRDGDAQPHTPLEPTTGDANDGESLPLPGWRWRRSTSDRFSQSPQAGVQFPTNVLFWGNNAHVTSHASSLQSPPPCLEHGQRGARSLPHTAIEIPRRNADNVMAPRCASSGASQGYASARQDQQQSKLPGAGLNVFKRLLSRERKVFPTEQDVGGSCRHPSGQSSSTATSGS